MTVYLNGAFIDDSLATIGVSDRGFLLGDGAFETIYVERGRGAFLSAHLSRLTAGLAVLGIPPPADLQRAASIIDRLAIMNGLAGSAAARISVSRGDGPRGLAAPAESEARPTLLVTLAPYEAPTGPARLALSGRRRYSGASVNGFKSLSGYIENILALKEARGAGADDAILVNENGVIASASAANLFVIDERGALSTPSLADGAMPGVVRRLVIDAAEASGLHIREESISPGSLVDAEVFMTNSLIGLRPAFLERPSAESAVFRRLQTWYRRRLAAEFFTPTPAGEELRP